MKEKPGPDTPPPDDAPRGADGSPERPRWLDASARRDALLWCKSIVFEVVLGRKTLPPSKNGRHVPLQPNQDAPLSDERRGGHPYVSNAIRTSRYTVYDFVPKQLFFQFSRIGNFYFLCVGVPQTVPGLSTTGNFTTILPLLFFVLVTVAKEGYDDFKRHRLDKVENANTATVRKHSKNRERNKPKNWFSKLRSRVVKNEKHQAAGEAPDDEPWTKTKWSDIEVGDVIKLARDEPVPADIVLLHADGENGLAYIETMALDGETNLKSKQVSAAITGCDTAEGITACDAEFVVEDPNPDLYKFDGKVTVDGKSLPLTSAEVIYRGSVLRNTGCAIGIVINTGEECKIRMNANQHPKAKKPALETVANKIVITLAIYVVVLSVGCSMGYVMWQRSQERITWYLQDAQVKFHEIIIGFIIQFNNVIPLALYVSLEIVKVGQLLMLNSDIEMYHAETDTPARCNTNTILENLGQVGYVFTDKTGTLTENVMKFRKLSIAGMAWLHQPDVDLESETSSVDTLSDVKRSPRVSTQYARSEAVADDYVQSPTALGRPSMAQSRAPSTTRRSSSQWRSTGRPDHVQPDVTTKDLLEFIALRPHSLFARRAKDYILAMALCHTCLPEIRDGEMEYQSSSPDELAIVRAAQELGYTVIARSSQSVTLRLASEADKDTTFEILDVIEFSSQRKRMSIVVRYPDGRICIICKGADSVILPRLKMANLALQKAQDVRKSADLEHELLRKSEQHEPRTSIGGRASINLRRSLGLQRNAPGPSSRPTMDRSKSFEANKMRKSGDLLRPSINIRTASFEASPASPSPTLAYQTPEKLAFLDDPAVADDSTIFTRCFKHLDDFATEGLRTLLFAQKFISEQDYRAWKQSFDAAATSLTDRQEKIEAAAETIEQSFNLVGASAIEDKLQEGVPDTIDKLRRANIKIWMLTGDKRETAINIAHSTRICQPVSDLYTLDVSKGDLDGQLAALSEDLHSGCIHSVVVIDGQTLAAVEKSPDLTARFYSVVPLVDSVICCRASPAQKALMVKTVRSQLRRKRGGRMGYGLTLAIGDGANDLAMISASHVGVGISGKEGLQAARVADYAVAQFRFLQRLLLVHGRWNYVRTAKFILCTFWKEMFFYLPTAIYQRYNGYTGTSLYEMASLTVFNTLFTSLCVICMGIWEQDLSADTLLAVPELYVYGQRNMGLNMAKYVGWMLSAACQGVLAYWGVWAGYVWFAHSSDQGLWAVGNLSFTLGVIWINYKCFILETHHKSAIVMGSFLITFSGWWAWQGFLSGIYTPQPSIYAVRGAFTTTFGRDAVWWLTLIIVLLVFILMETIFRTLQRCLVLAGLWRWPWVRKENDVCADEWRVELWQELEKDPAVREKLKRLARDVDEEGCEEEADVAVLERAV